MKKIFAALCVLMIVPTLALANSDMVSISELRQQGEAMGRWTQTYDTPNGEVGVDISIIVPEVENVPILQVNAVMGKDVAEEKGLLKSIDQENAGAGILYDDVDILSKLNADVDINAHDTITLYGASRMEESTIEAMNQMAECFTDIPALQANLGDRIAKMTHNEAAYIANCAAGALQLCAAVCLARGSDYIYRYLPDTKGNPNEIIVLHSQHNCYDKALEAAGAKLKIIGDADEVLLFDLEGSFDERTAAVFFCPVDHYASAALSLKTVVEIAHAHGVPVIVDAAAQLPPMENLWRYTDEGADMVVFSGGKTLRGPQASGLILGKRRYIEECRRFGAPMHGVCRSAKATKESMIGLYVAVKNFMATDWTVWNAKMDERVERMLSAMRENPLFAPYRVDHGSVGQSYPRAFAHVAQPCTPEDVVHRMREQHIFIGMDKPQNAIYLSPQNLTDEECGMVCEALKAIKGFAAD